MNRSMQKMLFAAVLLSATFLPGRAEEPSRLTALDVKSKAAQTFYVDDRAGNNQVSFYSQSIIEDFTGVCNKVGGECNLDPANLEAFRGSFWVRVEDLRTGIELRDRHLQSSDWMDAAQFPKIVIEIAKAERVKKTAPNAATMTLVGAATIHGKTHPVNISATLTYLGEAPQTLKQVKGDLIRIRAEFEIKLSDYAIIGPKGSETIGLKVADLQPVKVTVFGSTEKPLLPTEPGKANQLGTTGSILPAKPSK